MVTALAQTSSTLDLWTIVLSAIVAGTPFSAAVGYLTYRATKRREDRRAALDDQAAPFERESVAVTSTTNALIALDRQLASANARADALQERLDEAIEQRENERREADRRAARLQAEVDRLRTQLAEMTIAAQRVHDELDALRQSRPPAEPLSDS